MFIDTHCHLSNKYYEDIAAIISENKKAGIEKMIISGCEKDELDETVDIINKYDIVYATIGFHPDQVEKVNEIDIDRLVKLITSNKKIIGVGEIGLDYHYSKEKIKEQKKLFESQLVIAEKYNLPVVIHSRDATKDTIDILKKYKVKGVIHCFSGSIETANIYISMGYKLGIGGVLTFKNSNLSKVVDQIDIKNIVLETDSPYLAPEPFRGKQNSSKYIPIIAKELSKIKELSIGEISEITVENTYDVFDFNC